MKVAIMILNNALEQSTYHIGMKTSPYLLLHARWNIYYAEFIYMSNKLLIFGKCFSKFELLSKEKSNRKRELKSIVLVLGCFLYCFE